MLLGESGAYSFSGRAVWLLCILWDGVWMGPPSMEGTLKDWGGEVTPRLASLISSKAGVFPP